MEILRIHTVLKVHGSSDLVDTSNPDWDVRSDSICPSASRARQNQNAEQLCRHSRLKAKSDFGDRRPKSAGKLFTISNANS